MATTSQHAFLSAFVDQLLVRSLIVTDGVQIASAGLGLENSAAESIQLFSTSMDEDWDTVGNLRRTEEYDVVGGILIVKPGRDETVIRAARERAVALLNEVEKQIRSDPTANNTVKVAWLSRGQIDQGYSDKGRWCMVAFTIHARAYLQVP